MQHTLQSSFSLSGKGLHTGLHLTVTFHPADEDHGYRIRRVDLEGQPEIVPLAENVIDTSRGTVVGTPDCRVSTIEHAMAALVAMGVDNCLIEVDGPEFPILDGSSVLYVREIQRVGLREQQAERRYLEVVEPFEYYDEISGSCLRVQPCDHFALDSTIVFPDSQFIQTQSAVLEHLSDFPEEIASARTFVFVREIEPLLHMGPRRSSSSRQAFRLARREASRRQPARLHPRAPGDVGK